MAGITRARALELREQGLKHCSGCEQVLPLEEFHVNRRNQDGRQSRCRPCQCAARLQSRALHLEAELERGREWREANRGRDRERKRRYHAEHPLLERLRNGKNRARQVGVPVEDVTPEALLADWERRGIDPERDVYTGEPLRDGWHLDHAWPLSAPGTPGHVVGNIVPCNRETNITKHRRGWVDFLADRAEAGDTAQHPAVGRYVTTWEPTEADKETAA